MGVQYRRRAEQDASGDVGVLTPKRRLQTPGRWVGSARMRTVCQQLKQHTTELLHVMSFRQQGNGDGRHEAAAIKSTSTAMGIPATAQETNQQVSTDCDGQRTNSDTDCTDVADGVPDDSPEDAKDSACDTPMQQQASDTAGKLPRTQGGDSTLVEWEAMEGIPWYGFVRQTQLARGVSTALAEGPTGVYKTRTDSARGSHLDSGSIPHFLSTNAKKRKRWRGRYLRRYAL